MSKNESVVLMFVAATLIAALIVAVFGVGHKWATLEWQGQIVDRGHAEIVLIDGKPEFKWKEVK